METSQRSQKRAHAGEIDENEDIAEHASKRVKSIEPASSDVSNTTNIFDLPGELRNVVYGYALDDLVATPRHPYDKLPWNSRFEDYISLLQTSKQVKEEVESLFLHGYLDRVTFYFTNAVELVEFARDLTCNRWPLDGARFYLFQDIVVNKYSHEYELKQITETLWKQQPGYDTAWNYPPGEYLYELDDISGRNGQWKPEEHGFQYLPGSHDACDTPSSCKLYKVLNWPTLTNGCKLAAYWWRAKPAWLEPPREFGGISFEGARIAGLTLVMSARVTEDQPTTAGGASCTVKVNEGAVDAEPPYDDVSGDEGT
ncbi:hypothetical protein LTS10_006974 [Elasticomyces elasticus]|nr:hypothetical protein LTS10_006974 [Elasticomyces elasticus]